MVLLTIFIFILSFSLPFIKFYIRPVVLRRMCAISFIYASVLSFNTLIIQSIGSGIGLYSGLFQVSVLTNMISIFILIISSLIIIIWPNFSNYSILSEGDNNRSGIYSSRAAQDLAIYKKLSVPLVQGKKVTYNNIDNNSKSNEYCLVILFNILGALFLISSADLVSMYLSIELQSFGLYILTTLYKEKYSSTSAGLKYFLLGGLSSCIILLGSGLIYSYTGLTNLDSIYNLISVYFNNTNLNTFVELDGIVYSDLNNNRTIQSIYDFFVSFSIELKGLSLGVIFIFSGFLFKIAASPFHNWAPDVYDDSPTLVTIWLTIMPKISILILLLELQIGIDLNLNMFESFGINFLSNTSINVLTNLLLLSSLLSLLIGSIVGLSQIRIKRLLAYSTISHIGFLLLALSVFSNSSVEAFIFYIIQYTITNLNIFLIILGFGYLYSTDIKYISTNSIVKQIKTDSLVSKQINDSKNKIGYFKLNFSDIEYISSLKGLFYKNPLLSISFSVCLFSFAGVPPLMGFFAKQQVLYASNSAGYFFLSLVAILVSVISASYYLKIIKIINSVPLSLNNNNTKTSALLDKDKDKDKREDFTFYTEVSSSVKRNFEEQEQEQEHNQENLTESQKIKQEFIRSLKNYLMISYTNFYDKWEAPIQNKQSTLINKNKYILDFINGVFNRVVNDNTNKYLTSIHSFIISILTLFILLFIFNPEILLNFVAITSSLILNL